MIEIK